MIIKAIADPVDTVADPVRAHRPIAIPIATISTATKRIRAIKKPAITLSAFMVTPEKNRMYYNKAKMEGQGLVADRQQQVLHDKKWIKFLGRVWPLKFAPFAEFALAAGSMALGNVRPASDFDVIVGAKLGRIFTARFFAVAIFGLLGWRRTKLNHKEEAADKICLNHFITEKSFRLSPPHDKYWQTLYANLVPVFGDVGKINAFFAANSDWLANPRVYLDDFRHQHRTSGFLRVWLEKILSGRFGNWLEGKLRRLQIARIERGLQNDPPGYKPRIIYTDAELEFHPDTKRIEILKETL